MATTYQEVAAFIRDFEACCLPKSRWTHHAHLMAGFWYLHEYATGDALSIIRERIQRHNESVGTVNSESSGYHETITRLYMTGIAVHRSLHETLSFQEALPLLLASPLAEPEWPLGYYSRDQLFSVVARREWVEPDLLSATGHATLELALQAQFGPVTARPS